MRGGANKSVSHGFGLRLVHGNPLAARWGLPDRAAPMGCPRFLLGGDAKTPVHLLLKNRKHPYILDLDQIPQVKSRE